MKKLMIDLPDTIDLSNKEILNILAVKLYEMGKLSIGQAAELAGYTKRTFMGLLGEHGVSIFNTPIHELDSDLRNAKHYHC